MEPWQSWTVVLIGGGAAWYYYSNQQKKRKGKTAHTGTGSEAGSATSARRRDDTKARAKRRKDGDTSSNVASESDAQTVQPAKASSPPTKDTERVVKRKGAKTKEHLTAVSSAVDADVAGAASRERDADEGDVDKEFARQLSGLKAGSTLAPPARTGHRQRTMKQSRASSSGLSVQGNSEDASRSHTASATSSTTGADADDDLSPAASPALGASGSNGRSAGDVSDMLEPPAPGPAVVKIVASDKAAVAPRQQQAKPQLAAETKRQRQNKRKAEEKKVAREAAEQDRRVLLEKQLRTAREAEGRPARNGLGVSAKAPTNSPWAADGPNSTSNKPQVSPSTTTTGGSLLDTFDQGGPAGSMESRSKHPPSSGGNANKLDPGVRQSWDGGLPSEEEQMKMLQEMDDSSGWNTVSKGKKGRKTKMMDASSDTTGAESSENDRLPASTNGIDQGTDGSSHVPPPSTSGVTGGRSHPADSDWAVV